MNLLQIKFLDFPGVWSVFRVGLRLFCLFLDPQGPLRTRGPIRGNAVFLRLEWEGLIFINYGLNYLVDWVKFIGFCRFVIKLLIERLSGQSSGETSKRKWRVRINQKEKMKVRERRRRIIRTGSFHLLLVNSFVIKIRVF